MRKVFCAWRAEVCATANRSLLDRVGCDTYSINIKFKRRRQSTEEVDGDRVDNQTTRRFALDFDLTKHPKLLFRKQIYA